MENKKNDFEFTVNSSLLPVAAFNNDSEKENFGLMLPHKAQPIKVCVYRGRGLTDYDKYLRLNQFPADFQKLLKAGEIVDIYLEDNVCKARTQSGEILVPEISTD